jgi:heme exporter protein D
MFDSFSDFFWSFMALSGFMFWICVAIFVVLLVIRGRTKKRRVFYE